MCIASVFVHWMSETDSDLELYGGKNLAVHSWQLAKNHGKLSHLLY